MEDNNMYTELMINGEVFKLKLTTRASIQLEKSLGYNPITMLMEIDSGKMPKLMDVLIILHACLQAFHHGYTLEKTMDLFDRYVEDGKSMFDLIPVFIEVFQQSGYITKGDKDGEESEKN
jgi:hypothetical protein